MYADALQVLDEEDMRRNNPKTDTAAAIDEAVEMIRRMTPEERLDFLTYRAPGVEMTDMTGMFGDFEEPIIPAPARRHSASV